MVRVEWVKPLEAHRYLQFSTTEIHFSSRDLTIFFSDTEPAHVPWDINFFTLEKRDIDCVGVFSYGI